MEFFKILNCIWDVRLELVLHTGDLIGVKEMKLHTVPQSALVFLEFDATPSQHNYF